MTVIDLTHAIHPDMPVFPGMEQPIFDAPLTIEANGFLERRLTMFSHTGTHLDAPAHILSGAPGLDALAPETFIGPGCVIAVTEVELDGGSRIGVDIIEAHADALRQADFVLLRTGWDTLWGEDAYFAGFPALTIEAAQMLASCGLKGVGIDAISIDAIESTKFEVHRVLLGAGLVVVENLVGLDRLPATGFTFHCAPLKIAHGDGSPVRALAVTG